LSVSAFPGELTFDDYPGIINPKKIEEDYELWCGSDFADQTYLERLSELRSKGASTSRLRGERLVLPVQGSRKQSVRKTAKRKAIRRSTPAATSWKATTPQTAQHAFSDEIELPVMMPSQLTPPTVHSQQHENLLEVGSREMEAIAHHKTRYTDAHLAERLVNLALDRIRIGLNPPEDKFTDDELERLIQVYREKKRKLSDVVLRGVKSEALSLRSVECKPKAKAQTTAPLAKQESSLPVMMPSPTLVDIDTPVVFRSLTAPEPSETEAQERLKKIQQTLTPNIEERNKNNTKADEVIEKLATEPLKTPLKHFIWRIVRRSTKKSDNDLVAKNTATFRFGDRTIDELYNIYIQKHLKNFPDRVKVSARETIAATDVLETPSVTEHSPLVELALAFPFKSKKNPFPIANTFLPIIPEDHQLKPLRKLERPYFSPEHDSWEIDFAIATHPSTARIIFHHLFMININTKYLFVYSKKNKTTETVIQALKELMKKFPVKFLRGDGEAGFDSIETRQFCKDNNIRTFFTSSPFTNHNRVVDSAIRTIRNAFGKDIRGFADKDKIQQMVNIYNKTTHCAFNNKYSPEQVQDNPEIEGAFIRLKQYQLQEAKEKQKHLLNYKYGNVLMIHLDMSKTQMAFDKRRRNFNELAIFQRYFNGNVVVRLVQPYRELNKEFEIPIQFTKFLAEKLEDVDKETLRYFTVR